MIVVKAKRVTLINFFMIRSPFIQFYQGSSTREKERVYVILAKVGIVYYNGNQVSGKYNFFGKITNNIYQIIDFLSYPKFGWDYFFVLTSC